MPRLNFDRLMIGIIVEPAGPVELLDLLPQIRQHLLYECNVRLVDLFLRIKRLWRRQKVVCNCTPHEVMR